MPGETIREGRTILVGSTEVEEETGQPIGKVLVDRRPLNNVWFVGRYPEGLHFQGTNTFQYWVTRRGADWSVGDDEDVEVFRAPSLTQVVEWINTEAANPNASVERGRRAPRAGFHVASVQERRAFKVPAFYVDVFAADDPTAEVAAYGFDAFDTRREFRPRPKRG